MADNNIKPAIKFGWLRVILLIIPYTIIAGAFQLLGFWLLSVIDGQNLTQMIMALENNQNDVNDFLIVQIFTFFGTCLVLFIFRKYIDRKSFFSMGFSIKFADIYLGIILGAVTMIIGSVLLYWIGYFEIDHIGMVFPTFISSLILCIFISLNEEILVRGYILNNFMESFNKYAALLLSSILFAILHMFNPNVSEVGLINLFLAGVLLGASYIYTKNLWFPIALHFSWNFFQGPILGYNVSGIEFKGVVIQKPLKEHVNFINGGDFGFEGSFIATILSILMIGFVMVYFKSKMDNLAVS